MEDELEKLLVFSLLNRLSFLSYLPWQKIILFCPRIFMDSCAFRIGCHLNSTRYLNCLLPAQPSPLRLVTSAFHHEENHHHCSPFRPRCCPWHCASSPPAKHRLNASRITDLLWMQPHILRVWLILQKKKKADKFRKIETFIEMCNTLVKYLAVIIWHYYSKIQHL